jgi:hypothetical protein
VRKLPETTTILIRKYGTVECDLGGAFFNHNFQVMRVVPDYGLSALRNVVMEKVKEEDNIRACQGYPLVAHH